MRIGVTITVDGYVDTDVDDEKLAEQEVHSLTDDELLERVIIEGMLLKTSKREGVDAKSR